MYKYINNIIIKTSLLAILVLNFGSCKKLLDKNPLDQISSTVFWKTQRDAEMALAMVLGAFGMDSLLSSKATKMLYDVRQKSCLGMEAEQRCPIILFRLCFTHYARHDLDGRLLLLLLLNDTVRPLHFLVLGLPQQLPHSFDQPLFLVIHGSRTSRPSYPALPV